MLNPTAAGGLKLGGKKNQRTFWVLKHISDACLHVSDALFVCIGDARVLNMGMNKGVE